MNEFVKLVKYMSLIMALLLIIFFFSKIYL